MKAVDAERFGRVELLFDEVFDLDPQARGDLLARRCAEDAGLREEVEALFAIDATPTRWQRAVGASSRSLIDAGAKRMLGGYRLLHEIGQGGMATVFLAERADGAFVRQVAIKLLRGFPDRESLRRMRREREMLAQLRHPGIALLHDGGRDRRRPALPRDGIRAGRAPGSLLRRAPAGRSGTHRRLPRDGGGHRLRAPAADRARRHQARERVVDTQGQVKVLDFGIGRVLDAAQSDPDHSISQVRYATPDYASPEQQAGARVSIAGDVFCMGRVLAELLAGRVARGDHKSARMSDWTGVADAAAARGLDPVALRRTLRGDLDAIVACACADDPEARYPDVPALIDDLRRYLERRPVRARRAGRVYAATKWFRRHGLKLLLSAIVGGVVLVAGAGYLIETRRAAMEARVTRGITALARDAFVDIGAEDGTFGKMSAREYSTFTALRIERAGGLDPLVRTRFLFLVGLSQGALGELPRAQGLIDQAVALRRERLGRLDTEGARMMAIAAQFAILARDRPAAEARVAELLALEPTVYPLDAEDEIERTVLSGQLHELTGDPAQAEADLRRAFEAALALHGATNYRIGEPAYRLAKLLQQRGKIAEALPFARLALSTHAQEFGAESLQAKRDRRLLQAIESASAGP
jgi:serine/threonine-protein kinase